MLLARHFLIALCYLMFSLLIACSPEPESGNDAENENEYHTEDSGDASDESEWDADQAMLDNGWRWGTLSVKVQIHQKGDAIHTTANDKTESRWETVITAESSQQVLVAPDLQVLVPEDGDEETRHSAFKSEPYYISEKSAPAVVKGSVTNQLSWNNLSPDANDIVSMTRMLDEAGEVTELDVESMHPSLYGQGYEVRIRMATRTRKVTVETAQPANNGTPVVNRSEEEDGPVFSFLLFPVPNVEALNDYPFWEPETPADMIEQARQQHLETFSLLQKIQADAVPVLTEMRTGLRTAATKDTLELTYEYNGDKQVAFMMGIESFIGKPSPNLLRVTINLSADQ